MTSYTMVPDAFVRVLGGGHSGLSGLLVVVVILVIISTMRLVMFQMALVGLPVQQLTGGVTGLRIDLRRGKIDYHASGAGRGHPKGGKHRTKK